MISAVCLFVLEGNLDELPSSAGLQAGTIFFAIDTNTAYIYVRDVQAGTSGWRPLCQCGTSLVSAPIRWSGSAPFDGAGPIEASIGDEGSGSILGSTNEVPYVSPTQRVLRNFTVDVTSNTASAPVTVVLNVNGAPVASVTYPAGIGGVRTVLGSFPVAPGDTYSVGVVGNGPFGAPGTVMFTAVTDGVFDINDPEYPMRWSGTVPLAAGVPSQASLANDATSSTPGSTDEVVYTLPEDTADTNLSGFTVNVTENTSSGSSTVVLNRNGTPVASVTYTAGETGVQTALGSFPYVPGDTYSVGVTSTAPAAPSELQLTAVVDAGIDTARPAAPMQFSGTVGLTGPGPDFLGLADAGNSAVSGSASVPYVAQTPMKLSGFTVTVSSNTASAPVDVNLYVNELPAATVTYAPGETGTKSAPDVVPLQPGDEYAVGVEDDGPIPLPEDMTLTATVDVVPM